MIAWQPHSERRDPLGLTFFGGAPIWSAEEPEPAVTGGGAVAAADSGIAPRPLPMPLIWVGMPVSMPIAPPPIPPPIACIPGAPIPLRAGGAPMPAGIAPKIGAGGSAGGGAVGGGDAIGADTGTGVGIGTGATDAESIAAGVAGGGAGGAGGAGGTNADAVGRTGAVATDCR